MIMYANDYGKNKDGSENKDYCHYCFHDGSFRKNETMEEMIESCIPFKINGTDLPDAESARSNMMEYFHSLKRWSK
jgi:hypothetical protein